MHPPLDCYPLGPLRDALARDWTPTHGWSRWLDLFVPLLAALSSSLEPLAISYTFLLALTLTPCSSLLDDMTVTRSSSRSPGSTAQAESKPSGPQFQTLPFVVRLPSPRPAPPAISPKMLMNSIHRCSTESPTTRVRLNTFTRSAGNSPFRNLPFLSRTCSPSVRPAARWPWSLGACRLYSPCPLDGD